MKSSDIDAVALLFMRRFQPSCIKLSDDEVRRGDSFSRQISSIKVRLGSLDKGAAVACLNGAVVGFILFRIANDGGRHALQLEWIARDARLNKLGVATTLINWLIEFIKIENIERPIQNVSLMVNLMNDTAISLYDRLGFKWTEKSLCHLEDQMLGCMELTV
jgi:ribosomal protein S18 acetylase RimI-like enzyme